MEMEIKNLKVWEPVHREVKSYAAKMRGNVKEISSQLLIEALEARGHTFLNKDLKSAKK